MNYSELYFEKLPNNLTKTWSPSGLELDNVEYAQIYCGGKSMTEVCPDDLKIRLEKIQSSIFTYCCIYWYDFF